MSKLITPWRIIVAAAKHVVRNVWLALATVLVLVLALMSVNVLVGIHALLEQSVRILERKVDLAVHFKPETPQAVVDQARFFLSSLGTVASVDAIPADQALAAFKERHGKNSELLGAVAELDQNPLGPALVVKAKKTSDYPLLVDALQNPQFSFAIESQSYDDHADAIAMVRQLGQSVRWFGGALIAVFALFSSLLVFNAIRVAIYTQREEIGVMRLVGASNPYIRLPFLLEGLFLAALSVAIAAGVSFAAASWLDPILAPMFGGEAPGLLPYFLLGAPVIFGAQAAVLGILVLLSSWAAVGRYLRR